MEKLREMNILSHHPLLPSLTDSSQDLINEDQDMKDAIIIRNTLVVAKLSCNMTCGVVRATMKPNQRTVVVFENAVDHACNVPPFHYFLQRNLLPLYKQHPNH